MQPILVPSRCFTRHLILLILLALPLLQACATSRSTARAPGNAPPAIPLVKKTVKPAYPPEAISDCSGGRVEVAFRVSFDGAPIGIRIVKSTPAGLFDEDVYAAFRRWVFEPSTVVTRSREYRMPFVFEPPKDCTPGTPVSEVVHEYRGGKCPKGTVLLVFTVLPDGSVEDVSILGDSALPAYADADAIRAIKRWRFDPYLKDGKPSARRARLELTFTGECRPNHDDIERRLEQVREQVFER